MNVALFRMLGCTFLISFTGVIQLWGQSYTHRKHSYQWDEHSPVPVDIHPDFVSAHAVVLHEETRISLINQTFRQYVRIKFLDEYGIRQFNQFSFPHPVDALFWYFVHPALLHDSLYAPKLLDEDFLFVTARIIRNGELINANLLERVESQKIWVQGARLDHYAYHLMSRALKPGDELELVYSHKLPDVSRYVVNRSMPVQSSVTILMFPLDRIYFDGCTDASAIRDSSMEKKYGRKYRHIRYEMKNVRPVDFACTDFSSSQLSVVSFYPVTDQRDETLLQSKFNASPFLWREFLVKEVTIDEFNSWEYYSRQIDENNITFNEIYQRYAPREPTTAIETMNALQTGLMQHFDFKNDYGFYSGYDLELERISHYLNRNILRQRSVHRLYRELMNRLDTTYFITMITDKRVSAWTYPLYSPLLKTVKVFALMHGKTPVFYLPKNHQYGYFPNELPFYLQGVKLPLIPQKVPKADFLHNRFDYPLVITPMYRAEDNKRTTTMRAYVNLGQNQAKFDAQIQLQGNFSTSTRSLYLSNYKDSSLHRSYFQKLTMLNGDDFPFVWNERQTESNYPFKTDFNISYHSKQVLQNMNDSIYILKLNGLINLLQLSDEDLLSLHGLDYQYDFAYRDEFEIDMYLSRNVQLLNGADYRFLLDNEFASLYARLYQAEVNQLKMEVLRVQKTKTIPYVSKERVIEIERIIRKLLALQVVVKVI